MNISPENWVNLLETSVNSRKLVADKKQEHQYIVSQKDREYTVLSRSQLQEPYSKLSLSQIVEISEAKFEELKEQFKKDKITEQHFIELTKTISKYTEKLIDARKAKRNWFGWRVIRGIAKVVAGFFSIFLIGIPFYKKLKQIDIDFHAEHVQLKNKIRKPTREALTLLEKVRKEYDKVKHSSLGNAFSELEGIEKERAHLPEDIRDQIKQIPFFLNELHAIFSDKDRLTTIQERIKEDFPSNINTLYIEQFEKDMKRGVAFYRRDKRLKIEDDIPQPFYQLKGKARVAQGAALLKELAKQDKHWEIALQLVTNQTSLNTLFDAVIMTLNVNALSLLWDDSKNGKSYALKTAFAEHLPPITLEAIRNHQGQIERVNVKVKGYLDIIKYSTTLEKDDKINLFPKVIEGELSYSLKLGEEHRPIISNLHSRIELIDPFASKPST